jgi:hypothetical protein
VTPAAVASAEASADLPVRAKVGSYILVRRIGSGGTADVWLGRNEVSGGIAAVKVLSPRATDRPGVRAQFQREARLVARLAHPHVVPLFELGDDFVVMPFVDGTTLARRLTTPLAPAAAVRIVGQVAQALEHAHARGVVHRDVKPSNILLDRNETAFLADFGVATAVDDPAGRGAGTPRYMAPEQVRREAVGPAADQYALGLTLLEALGSDIATDMAAAIARLPEELPRALRDVIARATAASAAERFPSIGELADALHAVDLTGLPASVRLGEARREVDARPWLTRAWREERITDDLVRGDYRLSDLVAGGAIEADRARALLDVAGLADIGFSVYVSTSRLGELSDAAVSARASEVIALIHGWSSTRTTWRYLAPALCRDNALALVVVPDLYGFGESRYAAKPTKAQVDPAVTTDTTLRLLRLLRLGDMPTVVAAHSASAMGLLTFDDAALPPNLSRVAITPLLLSHDVKLKRLFRVGAWMQRTIGRIRWLRRLVAQRLSRVSEMLALPPADANEIMEDQLSISPIIGAQQLEAMARVQLHVGRQRRVVLIAGLDDPWVRDGELVRQAAEDLGLDRAHVHTLASGGHTPQLPLANHPEWTARNVDEIGRVIQSMMVTAHEQTRSPMDSATTATS